MAFTKEQMEEYIRRQERNRKESGRYKGSCSIDQDSNWGIFDLNIAISSTKYKHINFSNIAGTSIINKISFRDTHGVQKGYNILKMYDGQIVERGENNEND